MVQIYVSCFSKNIVYIYVYDGIHMSICISIRSGCITGVVVILVVSGTSSSWERSSKHYKHVVISM